MTDCDCDCDSEYVLLTTLHAIRLLVPAELGLTNLVVDFSSICSATVESLESLDSELPWGQVPVETCKQAVWCASVSMQASKQVAATQCSLGHLLSKTDHAGLNDPVYETLPETTCWQSWDGAWCDHDCGRKDDHVPLGRGIG